MKKRVLSLLLVLCLLVPMVPVQADAAATYSVEDAIAYAAAHWNDGVGACAHFVSKCIQAGGIDISTITSATTLSSKLPSVTGVGRVELKLDGNGYATKALNGDALAEGDVVFQYCKTHGKVPHVLLCAGFNSKGVAVYYAHNNSMNKGRYDLRKNTSNNHTASCNIVGQVVHLAELDLSLMNAEEAAYMEKCTKYASYMTLKVSSDSTYMKTLPCSSATSSASENVVKLTKDTVLTATAIYKNSAGNYWYKARTADGKTGFVYAANASVTGIPSGAANMNATLATTTPSKGKGVAVEGSITSGYMTVKSAVGTLKDALGNTQTKTITSGFGDISDTALNSSLKFGSLSRGPGTLTVKATLQGYYSADGKTLSTKSTEATQTLKFTVKETYPVIFDANGGTDAPASQSKTSGTNLTLTTDVPSRTNYSFLGWASSSSATEPEFQPGGTLNKDVYSGNMTLYAVWKSVGHVHAYQEAVVLPTCTVAGWTMQICDCGDFYITEEVPATGHSYSETVTAPTCTDAGYTTYTCACGDSYVASEVPALHYTTGEAVCGLCGEVLLEILNQPENGAAGRGELAEVTVEAEGVGLSYEWFCRNPYETDFRKAEDVTGATYALTMSSANNHQQVYCVVTNAGGFSMVTDTVTMYMTTPAIEIITQPADMEVPYGLSGEFTVEAIGEELTYTWYYATLKGGSGFRKIENSNSSTWSVSTTIGNDEVGYTVRCVITDPYGNKAVSDTAMLTISTKPPEIVTQPQNAEAAVGETIILTVEATGEELTYAWYHMDDEDIGFVQADGITGPVYTVTMEAVMDGRRVYCVATDKYGNVAVSTEATLSLSAVPVTIVSQSKSVWVSEGEKATVTVNAVGDGLTYKWYYKNPGASKYTYTSSFKGNTYSVTMNEERSGRYVYCKVTDAYGNTVKSKTVSVNMQTPLEIIAQPKSVKVAEGEKATVTVEANGDGLTYRWYYKNPGASKYTYTSSFTGSSYSITMNDSRDGRYVYCRVYDKYGNSIKTNTVSLRMK